MKTKTIGILGLGVFGQTIIQEMSPYDCDIIAIDNDPVKVDAVAELAMSAVLGDFTDLDLLRSVGIQNCDILVIATGSNLESAVLAVMHGRKLGVPQIIAKARSMIFEEVLYEVGVSAVVAPERDSGMRLATKILRNQIDEVLRLDDDTSVVEFEIPNSWIGKNVTELDLRRRYDLNLIGTREDRGEKLNAINVNAPLYADTIIVAIANSHTFEKYDYLGHFND